MGQRRKLITLYYHFDLSKKTRWVAIDRRNIAQKIGIIKKGDRTMKLLGSVFGGIVGAWFCYYIVKGGSAGAIVGGIIGCIIGGNLAR